MFVLNSFLDGLLILQPAFITSALPGLPFAKPSEEQAGNAFSIIGFLLPQRGGSVSFQDSASLAASYEVLVRTLVVVITAIVVIII